MRYPHLCTHTCFSPTPELALCFSIKLSKQRSLISLPCWVVMIEISWTGDRPAWLCNLLESKAVTCAFNILIFMPLTEVAFEVVFSHAFCISWFLVYIIDCEVHYATRTDKGISRVPELSGKRGLTTDRVSNKCGCACRDLPSQSSIIIPAA